MSAIRVLDLRDTHEVGGPGKTILETYRAIDSARFESYLGVFLGSTENIQPPFVKAAIASGLPVHVIRGRNQYDPRLIWRVADLVRRLDIDIVHAHEVLSNVLTYLAAKLRPVSTITTLHGWIGNGRKQRLLSELDKRVASTFDRVIVVSRHMREEMVRAGAPGGKLCLLHNAIVLERFRRTGRRGVLAELLGRELPGPVITCIGRISPEKGQADLVEALHLVSLRGWRFSAVLVGDGPTRPALLKRVKDLCLEESIHLPGYIDQSARLLEDSDMLVLPSHTEGLPNVALEALAMEVPFLGTRVGGTPEAIDDGETGRLVEPHSPAQLAESIVNFLEAPASWRRMASHGRVVVERDFDFAVRTRRLEQLYTDVVRERRR